MLNNTNDPVVQVTLSVGEAVQLLTEAARATRHLTPGSLGLSRLKMAALKLGSGLKQAVGYVPSLVPNAVATGGERQPNSKGVGSGRKVLRGPVGSMRRKPVA